MRSSSGSLLPISGRGTAKFPLGKPIPYELITALVQRLVAQRR